MDRSTFFEKFDQFADAPNAIPAIRELVLQLAVRGHLTARIGGESSKAQLDLADAFRIRRAKREEPDAEDVPLPIPDNWGWVAVGDSMDMFNGRAFKPEEWSTEGTPIIRIQNLNNQHAAFNRCKADLDPKIHVHDGDFLISWSGTPGTSFGAFIWNRGFAYLNQHIFRCELVKGVFEKKFLRLAINARLDEMISHAQGAVGLRHITKGKLESIRLPLPPLAEQKRIVAKVDELMVWCDRLEEQQHERETRHAALARASLARFADAPTPANLAFLFHKSYAIAPADLRKSILTLAVQGKLVPQDPNDEPAEEIAGRAGAERARFGPDEVGAPVDAAERPWSLPLSWTWVHLGTIANVKHGYAFSSASFTSEPTPYVLTTPGNFYESGGFRDRGASSKYFKGEVPPSFVFNAGDLIIPMTEQAAGLLGSPAFIPDDGKTYLHNQRLGKLEFYSDEVAPAFVFWFFNSEFFRGELARSCTGMKVRHTSPKRILRVPFALPPLAEQRRIVAKLEQLMALVGALETQLAASRATAANLLSAIVAELTGNPNDRKASASPASGTRRRGRPRKST